MPPAASAMTHSSEKSDRRAELGVDRVSDSVSGAEVVMTDRHRKGEAMRAGQRARMLAALGR
jgi:hypothetical protein